MGPLSRNMNKNPSKYNRQIKFKNVGTMKGRECWTFFSLLRSILYLKKNLEFNIWYKIRQKLKGSFCREGAQGKKVMFATHEILRVRRQWICQPLSFFTWVYSSKILKAFRTWIAASQLRTLVVWTIKFTEPFTSSASQYPRAALRAMGSTPWKGWCASANASSTSSERTL